MADIIPSIKTKKKFVRTVTWIGKDADTFLPYPILGISPRNISVQAIDGAADILGSLDGTNFYALSDFQGNTVALSDGDLSEIAQSSLFVKPSGIASTVALSDVTVTISIWR